MPGSCQWQGLSSPGIAGVHSSISKQSYILQRASSPSAVCEEGGRPHISDGTRFRCPGMPSSDLPGTGTGTKESHPHLPAASCSHALREAHCPFKFG